MYAAIHVILMRRAKMIFQPLSAQSSSLSFWRWTHQARNQRSPWFELLLIAPPIYSSYLSGPFMSCPLFECMSTTESLLWSLSGLMLLLTSSIGSVLTSSVFRAGGEGVKLSLSVDDPKLPPQLPFVVKLIVSFKLLLLLLRTLLFVLSVLLLLPLNGKTETENGWCLKRQHFPTHHSGFSYPCGQYLWCGAKCCCYDA